MEDRKTREIRTDLGAPEFQLNKPEALENQVTASIVRAEIDRIIEQRENSKLRRRWIKEEYFPWVLGNRRAGIERQRNYETNKIPEPFEFRPRFL